MVVVWVFVCVCFFFQAEDGIRDYKVTGVQTCALPISDFGSILTTAVDMQCIMTQTAPVLRCAANPGQPPYFRRTLPETRVTVPGFAPPPSVLQLETQTDIRLIKLRNRTSRLGVLHRLLKRLLAGAGHLGLQLQMALRDRETIAHFLERDGTRRLQTLRRQPRQPQLRGERHGEAPGVRGGQ